MSKILKKLEEKSKRKPTKHKAVMRSRFPLRELIVNRIQARVRDFANRPIMEQYVEQREKKKLSKPKRGDTETPVYVV